MWGPRTIRVLPVYTIVVPDNALNFVLYSLNSCSIPALTVSANFPALHKTELYALGLTTLVLAVNIRRTTFLLKAARLPSFHLHFAYLR